MNPQARAAAVTVVRTQGDSPGGARRLVGQRRVFLESAGARSPALEQHGEVRFVDLTVIIQIAGLCRRTLTPSRKHQSKVAPIYLSRVIKIAFAAHRQF
jgi:hypothetical protein